MDCTAAKPKKNKYLVQFDKLIIDPAYKHALPFKGLDSRHASAVICKHYGRRKDVIIMNLLMNRSSRAFIISQNGLEGFVDLKHDNFDSWLYETGKFIK